MEVDLSKNIFDSLNQSLERAKICLQRGEFKKASRIYSECAVLAKRFANYAVTPQEKNRRLKQAKEYKNLSKNLLNEKVSSCIQDGEITKNEQEIEQDAFKENIKNLIHKSSIKWEDIGGLEETKREIKFAYGIALAKKPHGISITGCRNILLYGPPGTGKTLLAGAVSGTLQATFFNVKLSSLMSKYFGESSKLTSTLYEMAREYAPSVIFLDEFESLCISRDKIDSGAERRILSNLLIELNGLSEKDLDKLVFTIGATNAPWLLDNAALSRFQKRIYVPLPDKNARMSILTIHIINKGHRFEGYLENLAVKFEGYSGREIEKICNEVILQIILEKNPFLEKEVDEQTIPPTDYELKVRPLKEEDFDKVIQKTKPDTTKELLRRYEKWGD